ncbi:MAG: glycosyltransferase family 39 protein [bacterium]
MSFFIDILLAMGIMLAAAGFGRKLMRALRVPEGGFWENFCAGAALGLGVLILTIFLLGVAGLLRRWILILPPLLFIAAAPADLAFIIKSGARKILSFFRNAEPLHRAAAAVTAFLFFLYLPAALAPPIHPDALVYQLAAPKIYVHLGRIVFLPDNFRASFPSGVNMLFILGLSLRGPALAQLLHLFMGALSALAIFAVAKRRLGRAAGLWAALIFSSSYIVSLVAPQAMTEMGFVLFGVLAFHYLLLWLDSGPRGEFLLSAAFCGFALSTRYQAAVWLACLAGFLAFSEIRRGATFLKTASRVVLYSSIAVALLSPWLIKNAVFTGNPVFPFLNQYFGSRYYDPASCSWMASGVDRPTSLIGYFRFFFFYPWLTTLNGFTNDTGFGPPANPAFLALLPGLLFLRPLPRFVRSILWFCLAVGLTFWAALLINTRFWLPVEALLCIAVGHLVSASFNKSKALFGIALLFVAANMLFACASVAYGSNSIVAQISVVSGIISRDDYLAQRMPAYRAIKAANRELPPGSKIMLGFAASEGYYLDRPYLYGEPYGQAYLNWFKLRGESDLLGWLRDKKVTHLLFAETYAHPGACLAIVDKTRCGAWDSLIARHFRPMKTIDDFMFGEIIY